MSEELAGHAVPTPDPPAPDLPVLDRPALDRPAPDLPVSSLPASSLPAPELAARINAMIAAHFDLDIDRLTPETEVASLGIDSLGMIEFMFEMEDKLGVKMLESRVPPATVQQVIDEIGRALHAQNPGV
jgi:acyl carrier protein